MILYYSSRRAFTLVELMIVIAIIGILAAALFPSLMSYQSRARDVQRKNDLQKLASSIELFFVEKGSLPQNDTDTSTSVECAMSNGICRDPGCWGAWDSGNNKNPDPNDTFLEPLKTYGYMTVVPRERFLEKLTMGSSPDWGQCTYRYILAGPTVTGATFGAIVVRTEQTKPNETSIKPDYVPTNWGEGGTGSTELVYFTKQN